MEQGEVECGCLRSGSGGKSGGEFRGIGDGERRAVPLPSGVGGTVARRVGQRHGNRCASAHRVQRKSRIGGRANEEAGLKGVAAACGSSDRQGHAVIARHRAAEIVEHARGW